MYGQSQDGGRPVGNGDGRPLAAPTAGPAISTTNEFDTSSPIFIGGGFDGYTPFSDIVGSYVEKRGSGNFVTHYQEDKIRRYIQLVGEAKKPIIMIGHSWGGSNAILAANESKKSNLMLDLLITIDPVGTPRKSQWEEDSFYPIAKMWISVIAEMPIPDLGDVIAFVGQKTPLAVQKFANFLHFDKHAHHGYFNRMMKTANAEAFIEAIYKMTNTNSE